jgi:hypothetical protein
MRGPLLVVTLRTLWHLRIEFAAIPDRFTHHTHPPLRREAELASTDGER